MIALHPSLLCLPAPGGFEAWFRTVRSARWLSRTANVSLLMSRDVQLLALQGGCFATQVGLGPLALDPYAAGAAHRDLLNRVKWLEELPVAADLTYGPSEPADWRATAPCGTADRGCDAVVAAKELSGISSAALAIAPDANELRLIVDGTIVRPDGSDIQLTNETISVPLIPNQSEYFRQIDPRDPSLTAWQQFLASL